MSTNYVNNFLIVAFLICNNIEELREASQRSLATPSGNFSNLFDSHMHTHELNKSAVRSRFMKGITRFSPALIVYGPR